MKNIFLILLSVLLINCSKDDNSRNVEDEIMIDSYVFIYMLYPSGIQFSYNMDNLVKIEYNNQNEIIKRKGSIIPVNPATGFNYRFTDKIYDTVLRYPNMVIIKRKITDSQLNIDEFKRTIVFDQDDKIKYKIIENDTIDYEYNTNGKLIKTKSRNQHKPNESTFYYNTSQNLDSVVTKKFGYSSTSGIFLRTKTIETFEEYDHTENPLKKLIIFKETFYRSLSENNFSSYKKKVFNAYNNNLMEQEERNWDFIYDENGNIQYNLF